MEHGCFEFGLTVLWAIWNMRTAVARNGGKRDSQGTAMFATSFYQEYKNIHRREEKQVCSIKQNWQRPPQGVVKINFDGSLKEEIRRGGIGVVARNDKGEVLGALHAFIEEITDACVIEAYAAIRALTFGQEMGFRDILLT